MSYEKIVKVVFLYLLVMAVTFFNCSCMHFPQTGLSHDTSIVGYKKSLRPIWLISGDLHADFVVEADWLVRNGCKLPESVKPYQYLCFGWGDRVAYTERWGITDIPNALFWPSESIVQVVAFNTQVEPTFPDHDVTKVHVQSYGGASLAHFLNQSFSYSSPLVAQPVTLREAKWGHGYFIKSPYTYYFPRMCNQWVATALQAAGVTTAKASVTMTSQSLKRDVERYGEVY